MAISSLGSGMDIPSLVAQLVAAERAPTENRIARGENAAKTQLSAMGSLKSVFSGLQSALDKLRKDGGSSARTATVPEEAGFTASAGTTAAVGDYDIEVLALASAHKLTSAGMPADTRLGTGKLVIEAGDETIEVEITEGRNTLADIRSAINTAAAGKGVSASLVNADDGQHLVLTATDTGTEGKLRITTQGGNGGLSALVYDPGVQTSMSETVAATDARVKVDGLERTSSSNSLTDLLPGVTLNLTEAKPGETFTLKIGTDNAALQKTLQSFVSAYNAAISMTKSLTAYNSETNTAAALTGDSMVRGLQSQLRNLASEQVVDFKALGLKINTDGTLALDTTELTKGLAEDPGALSRLFSGDEGYGAGLEKLLDSVLEDDGLLDSRTDSLNARLKTYNTQYEDLDRRMESLQARYTAQFTAMEQLVTQLQGSSGFLSQQLVSMS
ncbi:flagellar filament capping protein FliD [Lysobacter sp.]|uniref:flagellar filament capping protein FliD n=1 Tax=Lysobacter sp. TaxID=72226 RepID=UPI002D3C5BF1|nr:flagellar filament capping protein FliD [Lysobacter sp.]HZX75868.1 flagellar filament capping protein FliD [Lysobacter sp.]